MSAWGKSNEVKDDFIVSGIPAPQWIFGDSRSHVKPPQPQIFATDAETKFSQQIGWTMGERTGRYALIVDHGKVTYAEQAAKGGVEGTDAASVLAKL